MTDVPLVSCIMPTANRRRYVPQAIRLFQRQTYPKKELVILDDGSESVEDLIPPDPAIRYIRLTGKRTLGAKRNECVQASRGELIMHWDDDDWSASHRIAYQVEALLRQQAEVCGVNRLLFHDPRRDRTWLYEYPSGERAWLAGGPLLYTRDFWRRSPFPDTQVASDTSFIFNQRLDRAAILPDHSFYVAMLHSGNTSPKRLEDPYWRPWAGNVEAIMGSDLSFYRSVDAAPAATAASATQSTTFTMVMAVHNAREMVKMSTLRTLRHSAGQSARLVVVDNGSTDGTAKWLDLLAQRGDIELIRAARNLDHGPALELARQRSTSPYIVTLDSDAFPLADDWLLRLRASLEGKCKAAGILHHRDYIHPSCLMIERRTLDELGLTFLNEKDKPSRLDVAERISHELKRRGYCIAGLKKTASQRKGSASEPVDLGSEYEGLVHHQWYTTRAAISGGATVDDVDPELIDTSLEELFAKYHAEPREAVIVLGMRARPGEQERLRNAKACLRALNLQTMDRWRYRVVVVEQDAAPQLEEELAPLCDRYVFVYNPGPYNRSWALNVGAFLQEPSGPLCLMDADLLVPSDFLTRSLAALNSGARALLPYTEVLYLDATSTALALAGDNRQTPRGQLFNTSEGGCIWVDAKLYREVQGHDERFRGWGREDREFSARIARHGRLARLPGRLLHLDHPRPAMEDRWANANAELLDNIHAGKATAREGCAGDPLRYGAEAPSLTAPSPPRRDWENWNCWTPARIERIVCDERRQLASSSGRWQLANTLVRLGSSVLDVGCGPGALWTRLEDFHSRVSWIGTDVTSSMLNVAHRLFPHVPKCRADSGALPFRDRSVEVVSLRHVLEHLPLWLMNAALKEALRVAAKFVVIDFYVLPARSGSPMTHRVGENFLETRWTLEAVEGPLRDAGWVMRERFRIDSAGGDEVWIYEPRPSELVLTSGPKVSIIMPTYRRLHTIFHTVDRIRTQTYTNWELIIIDNAGSGGYEFGDPRIRVVCRNKRPSASYARNEGVSFATGDLVCFFDDDDEMFPEYLRRYVDAFEANPRAQMVRCGMYVTGDRINYSYATPECCVRRRFVTPTWTNDTAHDQLYFARIVQANRWSEANGEIVILRAPLCRAKAEAVGGLRGGSH